MLTNPNNQQAQNQIPADNSGVTNLDEVLRENTQQTLNCLAFNIQFPYVLGDGDVSPAVYTSPQSTQSNNQPTQSNNNQPTQSSATTSSTLNNYKGGRLTPSQFQQLVMQAIPLANTGKWAGKIGNWANDPNLYKVVHRENSSLDPNAQNPTSDAYGLGQFKNQTWAGVGIAKTNDPLQQTIALLRYIADRYTNPEGAWASEINRGYY